MIYFGVIPGKSFEALSDQIFNIDLDTRWITFGGKGIASRSVYRDDIQLINPDISDEAEEGTV